MRTNPKVVAILREKQLCCITLRGAHCTVGRVFASRLRLRSRNPLLGFRRLCTGRRLFSNPKYTRQKTPVSSIFCCNTNKRWLFSAHRPQSQSRRAPAPPAPLRAGGLNASRPSCPAQFGAIEECLLKREHSKVSIPCCVRTPVFSLALQNAMVCW